MIALLVCFSSLHGSQVPLELQRQENADVEAQLEKVHKQDVHVVLNR